MKDSDKLDAVVIGGGPAGLAAATWLARYRLKTRLLDCENPRNQATWAVHGYLGLEDIDPAKLRRIGREQARHAGADVRTANVVSVSGEADRFAIRLEDGCEVIARRVLFATGLRDMIPEVPGLDRFYGSSIWHCPDCDGPEVVGKRIGVLGWGRGIAAFCMEMLTWTDRITLFTHSHDPELPERSRQALERFRIPVRTEVIRSLEGTEGAIERVVLDGGGELPVEALFFHLGYGPASTIPADLGCEADGDGILDADKNFQTTVPGVYAAGDIVHGSKLAIDAAAQGTRAAIGIYRSLLPEERRV